jgi:hypothetical protein
MPLRLAAIRFDIRSAAPPLGLNLIRRRAPHDATQEAPCAVPMEIRGLIGGRLGLWDFGPFRPIAPQSSYSTLITLEGVKSLLASYVPPLYRMATIRHAQTPDSPAENSGDGRRGPRLLCTAVVRRPHRRHKYRKNLLLRLRRENGQRHVHAHVRTPQV